jgi:hypothetical protein
MFISLAVAENLFKGLRSCQSDLNISRCKKRAQINPETLIAGVADDLNTFEYAGMVAGRDKTLNDFE